MKRFFLPRVNTSIKNIFYKYGAEWYVHYYDLVCQLHSKVAYVVCENKVVKTYTSLTFGLAVEIWEAFPI